MTSDRLPDQYFADALDGREDITDRYEVLGDIPQLVDLSQANEDGIVREIRRLIEGRPPGVQRISSLAQPMLGRARTLYHSDLIASVDGTDAVSPLRFVSDTIYAVGMVLVTPRTHHRPQAYVTRTRASHHTSAQVGTSWQQDVQNWADHLRGAREHEQSWTSTFREYGERELAYRWLQEDDDRIVLIDGPVLTQNMLTQNQARDLLKDLVATERVIGFIKNLSANPLLEGIGHALRPGEVFVLADWKNILTYRFATRQQNISKWIEDHGEPVVRAVYKVRTKPFAIECTSDLLPLALAILEHDNDGALDHDIPMLLQIADSQVRARFNGQRAHDEVLARFSAADPQRFLALTNERDLR